MRGDEIAERRGKGESFPFTGDENCHLDVSKNTEYKKLFATDLKQRWSEYRYYRRLLEQQVKKLERLERWIEKERRIKEQYEAILRQWKW